MISRRSNAGFWESRGIRSVEQKYEGDEGTAAEPRPSEATSNLQGLHDQGRTDSQTETGTASGSALHDTSPSQEEDRQ